MISVIIFIAACFLWDGLKKKLRGTTVREVKFRDSKLQKAKCGCLFEPNSLAIFQPCTAHKLMIKVKGE